MRKFILIFILSLNLFGASELEFRTLLGKFSQTITSQDQKIIYTGSLAIDSKFGAFWQYDTPMQKLIYFNKNQITIVEPELEQAIITSLKSSPDIAKILKNAKKLSNDKFQAVYEDITYDITTQNSLPKLIAYEDKLGNKAVIEFIQISKDEPISKELLAPQIPSNYDIISN